MGPSPAVLLIYELPSPNPDVPLLYPAEIPVLALCLPEIDHAVAENTEWELVGGSVQSAIQSSRASGGDFSAELGQTLVLVRFRVAERWYELVTPSQRILEFLPPPGFISMSPGMFSLLDVSWTGWGPECAHIRQCEPLDGAGTRDRLQASLFGMRHVLHHPVLWDDKLVVRVNDYQPSRVRRTEAHQTPTCIVRHMHQVEGEWADGIVLQTDLPYIETNTELPVSWQERNPQNVLVSINEDGIILIDVSVSIIFWLQCFDPVTH